jgi:hypothetical protein
MGDRPLCTRRAPAWTKGACLGCGWGTGCSTGAYAGRFGDAVKAEAREKESGCFQCRAGV